MEIKWLEIIMRQFPYIMVYSLTMFLAICSYRDRVPHRDRVDIFVVRHYNFVYNVSLVLFLCYVYKVYNDLTIMLLPLVRFVIEMYMMCSCSCTNTTQDGDILYTYVYLTTKTAMIFFYDIDIVIIIRTVVTFIHIISCTMRLLLFDGDKKTIFSIMFMFDMFYTYDVFYTILGRKYGIWLRLFGFSNEITYYADL